MRADLIETIVRAENLFPQTFADVEERDWGVLFVTPTIRDSHDGNHACVLKHCNDVEAVVDEIVAFYEDRGLAPRVFYLSADDNYPDLKKALRAVGFTIRKEDLIQIYLYQGPSRITPSPDVVVRHVQDVDANMFAALTSIADLRMAKALQRRGCRQDSWIFVGEIDGQIASVALLERLGDICRVDEVQTAEWHRGKGYMRAVIHAMVTYYQRCISEPLYLWTDNPIAERLYVEAGFVKLEHSLRSWAASRAKPQSGGLHT